MSEIQEKIGQLILDTPEAEEAGRKIAKSICTVATVVDNCLSPIAAMNSGFAKAREYFAGQFKQDVEEKTKDIPSENLQEPKPSKVAPILQQLAFCHEEEKLKEMYLELLSRTMDTREESNVHPSFAHILSQLTPDEAKYLGGIFKMKSDIPIVQITEKLPDDKRAYIPRYFHLIDVVRVKSGEPVRVPGMPAMIVNWQRLGLVTVDYSAELSAKGSYDWVERRPEYLEIKEDSREELTIGNGILKVTEFGRKFARAIGQGRDSD